MKNYTNIKYNRGIIVVKHTPVRDRKPGARYTARRTYRFPVYYRAFLLQQRQRVMFWGEGCRKNVHSRPYRLYRVQQKCVSEWGGYGA